MSEQHLHRKVFVGSKTKTCSKQRSMHSVECLMHKLTTQDLIARSSQMQGHLVPCFHDLGIILSISCTSMDYNPVNSSPLWLLKVSPMQAKPLSIWTESSAHQPPQEPLQLLQCPLALLDQSSAKDSETEPKWISSNKNKNTDSTDQRQAICWKIHSDTLSDQADLGSQQRFLIATSIPLHSCPASDQSIDEQSTCGRHPL